MADENEAEPAKSWLFLTKASRA